MAEPQKKRMQDLLNRQHQRMQELAAVKAKTDLRVSVPLFDAKYRFAEPEETEKIEGILKMLPFSVPGRIDTAKLTGANSVEKPTYQGEAWVCFLCGSESVLHLFLRGRIDDILRDIDIWTAVSPMLMLLLGDYRHIIFLDDNGSFTEAECERTDASAD